ncbi:helix-turn-helix domain-containing protein, partial [[Clostridium] scindens]|uniref:helix-turn-helix domain-containing protein n=1 Tax=Clostridium scindens (strain JCM 10418 / VPI 12708) TaxID=29347 RepID=UPI001D07EF13
MQEQECTLDVKTIEAAVAGEQWALGKVLEYYEDYIEELATVEIRQPDGSVKKIVDEDLKQQIGLKLLECRATLSGRHKQYFIIAIS